MKITNITNTLYQSRNNRTKAQKNQSNPSFEAFHIPDNLKDAFLRVYDDLSRMMKLGDQDSARLLNNLIANPYVNNIYSSKFYHVLFYKSPKYNTYKLLIIDNKSDTYGTYHMDLNDSKSCIINIVEACEKACMLESEAIAKRLINALEKK